MWKFLSFNYYIYIYPSNEPCGLCYAFNFPLLYTGWIRSSYLSTRRSFWILQLDLSALISANSPCNDPHFRCSDFRPIISRRANAIDVVLKAQVFYQCHQQVFLSSHSSCCPIEREQSFVFQTTRNWVLFMSWKIIYL